MRQWALVLVLSSILIYTAFVPFIHQVLITPPDKVFIGTHNNALDYPVFISEIIQSARGRWTFLAKYTTEKQTGTLIHPLYLPVGKIGAIFNTPAVVMYHLTRLVVAFIYCFAIYYFICFVFKRNGREDPARTREKRLLAFFLALFSAGFLTSQGGPNLAWWSGGDVFRRAVFLPHGVLKNVLLLLILVWMGRGIMPEHYASHRSGTAPLKNKYLVWSCVAGLFLGLLDPMNTMAVWGVIGVWVICQIRHIGRIGMIKYILYFIFSGVGLLYTIMVFDVTPWSVVKAWEAVQVYSVNFWEYANHIGITFYLGILGIVGMLGRLGKSGEEGKFGKVAVIVLTIPTIFFIVTNAGRFVGISGLRFFQIPVYVFLAIGTAELVVEIIKKVTGAARRAPTILIILFCIIILFISWPMYKWSLNNQWNEFQTWYGNIYVDRNIYDGALWLKENTPLDSAVLSSYLPGTVIPAISGNNVYIGHPVSTVNFNQKLAQVTKFYKGEMDAKEAKNMFVDGRIDYLFCAWGEQLTIDQMNYPFLKKVFTGTGTVIYKVQL